jgi:hypothetical protein
VDVSTHYRNTIQNLLLAYEEQKKIRLSQIIARMREKSSSLSTGGVNTKSKETLSELVKTKAKRQIFAEIEEIEQKSADIVTELRRSDGFSMTPFRNMLNDDEHMERDIITVEILELKKMRENDEKQDQFEEYKKMLIKPSEYTLHENQTAYRAMMKRVSFLTYFAPCISQRCLNM